MLQPIQDSADGDIYNVPRNVVSLCVHVHVCFLLIVVVTLLKCCQTSQISLHSIDFVVVVVVLCVFS